jgi:hypothetical protein
MKGAIEVSIGFLIIMVISALVLIFIMGWLGQIFPTLTRIGDYATINAENEMMKKFSEGSDAVASTIPTKVNFQAGSEVEFFVGIKKTSEQKGSNWFRLCVAAGAGTTECAYPKTANTAVAAAGDDGNDASGIVFLYAPEKEITNVGEVGRVTVLMQIPSGTEDGFYNFRFFACGSETQDFPTDYDFDIDSEVSDGDVESWCTDVDHAFGDTDFIVRVQ